MADRHGQSIGSIIGFNLALKTREGPHHELDLLLSARP